MENELKEVLSIFEQIKQVPSKNDKIKIINRNKDNELFKYFLNFLYNETITTGLSTKKIDKKIMMNVESIKSFENVEQIMNFVSKYNTGTDKIILAVQEHIKKYTNDCAQFMKEVLTKSYKCGITSSSVNKAIKGLIPEFKVQLANSYSKVSDKFNEEFWVTVKLDGHRTLVEANGDGTVIFRTRKGHQINGMYELEEEIKRVLGIPDKNHNYHEKGIILDGEITIADESTPKDKIFQETSKIIRKDGKKEGLRFHIFDTLRYEDFVNGESKVKYGERRESLDLILNEYAPKSDLVKVVPLLYHGKDKEMISKLMKVATDNGEEGIMINTDSPYLCKRHNGLLKVKEFFSCDGVVKDVFEGTGKYKGMLGGVYITFEHQIVKIGSGFSDEERVNYWNNPELIIGKVAEYQYFEKTENQKGGTDLRFATWKSNIRTDKSIEDVNYES